MTAREKKKTVGDQRVVAFFFQAHLFLAKGGRKAEQIR